MKLIKQKEAMERLCLSRSGLGKLMKRDASFPKPIKQGSTRQAAVYFIEQEIDGWIEAQALAREAA